MNKLYLVAFLLIVVMIQSCNTFEPTPMDLSKEKLIPVPVSLTATGSSFRITDRTKIIYSTDAKTLKKEAEYLANLLRPATGFALKVLEKNTKAKSSFFLSFIDEKELGKEGYKLTVDERNVILEANTPEGIFRGIQTLRQLLPHEIERDSVQSRVWEIASGEIRDYPSFEYRSAMLDVSRHFFGTDDVKHFMDWLVRYKMNTLHLHLSDDQGWRIQIKKWPRLTEIGGSTQVGGGKGGFYTQAEFSELVTYATDRYITIVPEIDMPGHTNAALASYAFLNCDDQIRELYTGTQVGFSTLCTDRDTVYSFLDDVIGEISVLINGPWFHIGGDESHVTKKEEYNYFIQKVQGIVTGHGKKMIGWDEIVSIDLNKDAVAQMWNSEENAREAVRQGVKLILSPGSRTYLDMKYDSTTVLGLKWAGYIEVDHAYDWYPEDLIEGVNKESILGVECPLWSETVTNLDEIEYLVFPRLLGFAEIGWSRKEQRNWDDYKVRLAGHGKLLEEMDINYYRSGKVPWEN